MKKILLFMVCFFFGVLGVAAQEINIYFYPNGGSITTSGFALGSSGYLSYNGKYYASYTDKDTIKNINSIGGKKFTLNKSGTSLVKNREWYFKNSYDGKTYFFSESKTYNVNDVLNKIGYYDNFILIDLYANWNDKKTTNGIDVDGKSSDKKNSIKTKTKEKKVHYVKIQYDVNGGGLSPIRASNIKVSNGLLRRGKSVFTTKKLPEEMGDLVNCNNHNYVNIIKSGYYVELGNEWNTKKDGTGKSYSQSKKYKFGDFCDASKKDCTVKLYVNWKKVRFNRVKELSVPTSVANNTGYISAQSIVYTGKYFVFVITNPERKVGLYIMKKNSTSNWVHYKTILDLDYNHGQDVTYIPKNNEIAFLLGKAVVFIDADSFKEKYKVNLSRTYSSFAYDRVNDIYYLGYGNIVEHKTYYTICNGVISTQTCVKKAFASAHYMTGQGSEVNNGYLYKLNYDAGHTSVYSDVTPLGRKGGEIDIYDSNHRHYNLIRFTADNGNKGTKNDLGEIEGIDFIDDQPYILFNGTRDGAYGRVYKVFYAKKAKVN